MILMCGIIGYTGKRNATGILLEGLAALEYRGYDSAGISVACGDGIVTVRRVGNWLRNLVLRCV